MADGRVNNGGARPGAGRRRKQDVDEFRDLLKKCAPKDKRREMIRKLVEDAVHPSFKVRHEARKLLMAYLFGKPTERHEVTGKDGESIPHIQYIEVSEIKRRAAERRAQIEALDD